MFLKFKKIKTLFSLMGLLFPMAAPFPYPKVLASEKPGMGTPPPLSSQLQALALAHQSAGVLMGFDDLGDNAIALAHGLLTPPNQLEANHRLALLGTPLGQTLATTGSPQFPLVPLPPHLAPLWALYNSDLMDQLRTDILTLCIAQTLSQALLATLITQLCLETLNAAALAPVPAPRHLYASVAYLGIAIGLSWGRANGIESLASTGPIDPPVPQISPHIETDLKKDPLGFGRSQLALVGQNIMEKHLDQLFNKYEGLLPQAVEAVIVQVDTGNRRWSYLDHTTFIGFWTMIELMNEVQNLQGESETYASLRALAHGMWSAALKNNKRGFSFLLQEVADAHSLTSRHSKDPAISRLSSNALSLQWLLQDKPLEALFKTLQNRGTWVF